MKKWISVILCICLLVTGCSKGKKEDPVNEKDQVNEVNEVTDNSSGEHLDTDTQDDISDKSNIVVDNKEDDDLIIPDEPKALKLNNEWAAVTLTGVSQPDFILPTFEAKVDPYVIKKDLSNIENIQYFTGFTTEQKNMLSKNGFVVLPSTNTRMSYIYDLNEYLKVPNFITADSVLHLYHQFFDKSLLHIESDYLYNYMDILTDQMLDKSIRLLDILEDEKMKDLQEKNIVYFLVARMLMLDSRDIDAEIKEELINIAKEEFDLIESAENFIESPLFGFDLDYSQFTVRGHYTRSEELGRFFKAMMWFGTAPLPFCDRDDNLIYENVLQSLLMSYTTFLDSEFICDAELWNNIYQPTKQYVGASDDINVFMMNGLRLEVFGETSDPNIFDDEEYYDKLAQAVKNLPEPKIQGKFLRDSDLIEHPITTPTGKQFRYMGQRYIMDSYITQELMMPILRPLPSALDVMGVFGSKTAEDLMINYYKPQDKWPEYIDVYNSLKEEVSEYGPDIWGENLYNGWLWAIKENLTEYDKDSGMPYFMTNEAWRAKSLNASIGSYTELKHDTVLYGKQGVAEGGNGVIYINHYHYVEPNVYLYSKLLYLTEYTMSVLRERNMLESGLERGATYYKELLQFLIECSLKELRNEKLTEEEYDRLLYYGASMANIIDNFLLAAAGDYEAIDLSDMLVTDIATNPGAYLSLATGFFDYIYVVIPVEGKLYLSRGAVYSSYEFTSDKRLTDEEWWALNGIIIERDEYVTYPVYTEPSENLPKQPDWINTFKSFENNVNVDKIDVEWEWMGMD
ncbi:MAG: DUF3160 domain-containing protein [Anaerolineaceae bacterium]|nr:MAG: DUF3160 domain-containing protein [Anaerolineaceae bacterium]